MNVQPGVIERTRAIAARLGELSWHLMTSPPDNGDGKFPGIEETVSPLLPSLALYLSAVIAPCGPLP
jgi:hypothetical protein